MPSHPDLILASGSPHRAGLLDRLQIPYAIRRPGVDESRREHEHARDYVLRLSLEKARAGAVPGARELVIGSDQAAVLDDDILGKPGNHANAVEQLRRISGRTVHFLTGLCLLNTATDDHQLDCVEVRAVFRQLDNDTIERYMEREPAYDCAGSFKSEALGIALLERMETWDPTALVGLPLIRLVSMLQNEGITVP